MTNLAESVFQRLARKSSRASAAAIGHRFVLNGAPAGLRLRGIDALCQMMGDWSVAILEMTVHDPTRGYSVRRHAVACLCDMVTIAIGQGYTRLTLLDCRSLGSQAQADLLGITHTSLPGEISAAVKLCNHLSQAVAEGHFPELADF